eukprot:TRINITY_DN5001_c0_g1_i1.p1 TRINITY_DN5001_c0_g1~~TRINITY_DN5001_c0_g1_i1.p1  ORF type:complete len:324 (+),score=94.18 TRINITY_DN5001_c0_g1_i1:119-1090(+)
MAEAKEAAQPPQAAVNRNWLSCYYVTKHSWRGKYKRIFAIGDTCVATINPGTYEETNKWDYADEFVSIGPGPKADNEFVITVKKEKGSKKVNTMTFSCDFRVRLLTDIQRHRLKFCHERQPQPDPVFSAYKQHWSEKRREVLLSVQASALCQVAPNGSIIASYDYRTIEAICLVSDYPGAFVVIEGGFGRMHLFALKQRDELLRKIAEAAEEHCGVNCKVKKKQLKLDQFRAHRLGKFSSDTAVTSLAEFMVTKKSKRHADPQSRLFCLSEVCILERDPTSYSIVTCRPLQEVFAIVRDPVDPQQFHIQYMNGDVRTYSSTER